MNEAGKFLSCLENIPELHLFYPRVTLNETFWNFFIVNGWEWADVTLSQTEKFCPPLSSKSVVSFPLFPWLSSTGTLHLSAPACNLAGIQAPPFPLPSHSQILVLHLHRGIHIRALLYILQITLLDWAIWITATLLPLILISVPPICKIWSEQNCNMQMCLYPPS